MKAKGVQNVTADAAICGAGIPVTIYGLHVISGAGGGGVVSVKAADTSGAVVLKHTGTASTGSDLNFGGVGVSFPTGAFVDIDANTASVLVSYEKI